LKNTVLHTKRTRVGDGTSRIGTRFVLYSLAGKAR